MWNVDLPIFILQLLKKIAPTPPSQPPNPQKSDPMSGGFADPSANDNIVTDTIIGGKFLFFAFQIRNMICAWMIFMARKTELLN